MHFSSVSSATEMLAASRYLTLTKKSARAQLPRTCFFQRQREPTSKWTFSPLENAIQHLLKFLVICGVKGTVYSKAMMVAFVLNV